MLFSPGRGPTCFRERPLFAEPSENKNFSEINPFSFSNKLEMIQKEKSKKYLPPEGSGWILVWRPQAWAMSKGRRKVISP
jgi:hypothetical protein